MRIYNTKQAYTKTSLTPPRFIEVPVPDMYIEQLCICALVCLFLWFFYWTLELFDSLVFFSSFFNKYI